MPKNILVDTSCLILLSKIGRLNFLHDLFDSIKTTTIVKQEFRKPLPAWIEIIDSKEADYLPLFQFSFWQF